MGLFEDKQKDPESYTAKTNDKATIASIQVYWMDVRPC